MDEILRILGPNRYRASLHLLEESALMPRDAYISFYKSRRFWESIPGDFAICAEIDSYLRRPIPDKITEYDYVCSKWPWHPNQAGGGGLSIRRVSAMLRICDELPDLANEIFDLDSWASYGTDRLELKYNSDIFVEASLDENTYGMHQWWTFFALHETIINKFYIPYLTLEIK